MLDDVKEVYYVTPPMEGDYLFFDYFLIPEKYHPEKYESSRDFIDDSDFFEHGTQYYGEHCGSSELAIMALEELQENHPDVLRYCDSENGYVMDDFGPYLEHDSPVTYKGYLNYMSEIDERDSYDGLQYALRAYQTQSFRDEVKRTYPDYQLCFLPSRW